MKILRRILLGFGLLIILGVGWIVSQMRTELGPGSLSLPGLADTSTQAGLAGSDISRCVEPSYERRRDRHSNGRIFHSTKY
jgi:hypothetical protein